MVMKMDELLTNEITEEYDITKDLNIVDIPTEDVAAITNEIAVDDVTREIAVELEDEVVIDISESMGWVSGDSKYHDSLLGVDFPNQHPITAITGLRTELDNIKSLKTVYADKPSIANYYKWSDGIPTDNSGYFVSLCADGRSIMLCTGRDVLGVTVSAAGFVGNQNQEDPRDGSYGLVAISGPAEVHCELNVQVGDYVAANAYGYAEKTTYSESYVV